MKFNSGYWFLETAWGKEKLYAKNTKLKYPMKCKTKRAALRRIKKYGIENHAYCLVSRYVGIPDLFFVIRNGRPVQITRDQYWLISLKKICKEEV